MTARAVIWGVLLLSIWDRPADAAEPRIRLDIPYVTGDKAHPLQKLDAYWQPDITDQPVMVYIHGGGWAKGDKRSVGRKPQVFAKHGFALVSVNYRLHPKADFRDQASDVAHAIKHVVDKSADVGVKADCLYLMGHSAGAHLAALVATDERYLKAAGLPLSTIKGVVLLDGAGYDIPTRLATAAPGGRTVFETVFGTDVEQQRAASPITHAVAGKGIPPFLILPIASRPESGSQSDALAAKLHAAGTEARVVRCPNETHGSINQDFGTEGQLATEETFRFLHDRQKQLLRESLPKAAPSRSP